MKSRSELPRWIKIETEFFLFPRKTHDTKKYRGLCYLWVLEDLVYEESLGLLPKHKYFESFDSAMKYIYEIQL